MQTPVQTPPTTQIIGGEISNQESAIGSGTDYRWRWWKVLAGVVLCVGFFLGLLAGGFALFASHSWTEEELNQTFVSVPMESIQSKFGRPAFTAADPTSGRIDRLEYRGAIDVRNKATGTLVAFHGESGKCVRVRVE